MESKTEKQEPAYLQGIHSVNFVCCTPFEANSTQTRRSAAGLNISAGSTELAELTVLADAEVAVPSGAIFYVKKKSRVYVPGNLLHAPWAKDRWSIAGVEGTFIFVPFSEVKLVKDYVE